MAGLRWGESASLYTSDMDWERSWIFVQRTWSDMGRRVAACKDGEMRKVKVPASLLDALRAHRETMALDASVKNWSPEQRQLMFPTPGGHIVRHGYFYETIWQPLLSKAGLPPRNYHAARHSYATGCWTRAMTFAGSRLSSATPRSRRPWTPTPIWTRPGTRPG